MVVTLVGGATMGYTLEPGLDQNAVEAVNQRRFTLATKETETGGDSNGGRGRVFVVLRLRRTSILSASKEAAEKPKK